MKNPRITEATRPILMKVDRFTAEVDDVQLNVLRNMITVPYGMTGAQYKRWKRQHEHTMKLFHEK